VVKRILWFTRSVEWSASHAENVIRKSGHDLPKVTPKPGWMKNTPFSVELSAEQFAGSSPVWIWEE
jgi:hypothetical protein